VPNAVDKYETQYIGNVNMYPRVPATVGNTISNIVIKTLLYLFLTSNTRHNKTANKVRKIKPTKPLNNGILNVEVPTINLYIFLLNPRPYLPDTYELPKLNIKTGSSYNEILLNNIKPWATTITISDVINISLFLSIKHLLDTRIPPSN